MPDDRHPHAWSRAASAAAVVLILAATALPAAFILPHSENRVYYTVAITAGDEIKIDHDVLIVGNVHGNDKVEVKDGTRIEGSLSAAEEIDNDGTVTGTVTENAAPIALPFPFDEDELRARADRVFDGDQIFVDAVVDDVVFVDGQVRFDGTLSGLGTIIATHEIRFEKIDGDNVSTSGGGMDGGDPGPQRLAVISFEKIRVGERRSLRGALIAGDEIKVSKEAAIEGVLVAGGKIDVKEGVAVTFVDFDQQAPTIVVTEPAPGTVADSATPRIAATFADDLSGVDPASVTVRLDQVDRTAEAAITAAGLELISAAPLEDGVHRLEITARDHSGKESGVSLLFGTGDVQPLALALNRPLPDASFDSGIVTIAAGFASDFGIELGRLRVSLDDVEIDPTTECVSGDDFVRCEVASPGAGAHQARVEIGDLAGVVAADRVDFALVVDATPPGLEIVDPTAAVLRNVPAPRVEIEYSDLQAGIDTESFQLTLDGVEITDYCAIAASRATCQLQPLAAGSHQLEARIADAVGNLATAGRTFELIEDGDLPVIIITSPVDDQVVNRAMIEVTGTATDDSGVVEVRVEGAPAALVGAPESVGWNAMVELEPGINAIVVEAVDGARNLEIVAIGVERVVDDQGPELRVTAPVGGSFVAEARPVIDLSFDDPSGVDPASLGLSVDGLPLAADCDLGALGGRCTPAQDLPAGTLTLDVRIADVFGNESARGVALTIDPEPVAITIDQPVAGLITRDDAVTITGSAGPDVVAVEAAGVAAALSGGSFSAFVPLREGSQMLVVLATKANGNTSTVAIEVTRDLAAPIVRIDFPGAGFSTGVGAIDVTGLVNDVVEGGVEPVVRVNGIDAEVVAGTFLVRDLSLSPGANVIEAVATDAAGNETRHAITVELRQPLGPRLEIAAGAGQIGVVGEPLAEPLAVVVRDVLGVPVAGRVVRFEVSRNSGTLRRDPGDLPRRALSVATDGSGHAAVLLTLGDTAGAGNNRVTASAVGTAGEVTFCASALPTPPRRILMVAGDNQRGAAGRPLPRPIEALVIDDRGNPVPDVAVTFEVAAGGGDLEGQGSLERRTDADGLVRASLTLGPVPGAGNNVVLARFPGFPGLEASFTASALAVGDPAATRFSGVVLDNSHVPIPGAVVSVPDGSSAVTDAAGRFTLGGLSPGQTHVEIDPSASPRPELFPPLTFETVLVAGNDNGLGQPIMLPFIDPAGAAIVGGAEDVTLSMPGVDGLTLTVFAGSATFPDGATVGELSISQVQLDKVPMAPPNGSVFMPPAWTIQPAGVSFDPPARLTIANDGLAIGRLIDIFQFDHELDRFINVGRATVDEEGAIITSDRGFGITRSGWGGCGQPPPPNTCGHGCNDDNSCTRDQCIGSRCRSLALDGPSCNDQKLCTEPDRCSNGRCAGSVIGDREGPSIQTTIDLGSVLGGLRDVWARTGATSMLDLKFNMNGGVTIVCCEEKQDKSRLNPKVTVSGTIAATSPDIPTPWSIPMPSGLPRAGVFFAGSVAVTGGGTFTFDRCKGDSSGSGSVDGTLSGSLKAVLKVPNVVKIAGGGTTGVSAIWSPSAEGENSLTGPFSAAWTGVALSVSVELLDGRIEVTRNHVIVQPTDLGSGIVTIPLNL